MCESSIKEVAEGMGSGLVGLFIKGTLASKSFTISRNGLTLRGQSLQSQQGPQIAKHQMYKLGNVVTTTRSNRDSHAVVSGMVDKAKNRTQVHSVWSLICGTRKTVAGTG